MVLTFCLQSAILSARELRKTKERESSETIRLRSQSYDGQRKREYLKEINKTDVHL